MCNQTDVSQQTYIRDKSSKPAFIASLVSIYNHVVKHAIDLISILQSSFEQLLAMMLLAHYDLALVDTRPFVASFAPHHQSQPSLRHKVLRTLDLILCLRFAVEHFHLEKDLHLRSQFRIKTPHIDRCLNLLHEEIAQPFYSIQNQPFSIRVLHVPHKP